MRPVIDHLHRRNTPRRIAVKVNPVRRGYAVIMNGTIAQEWLEYVTDACQRSILFLDLLRRRGNEEREITSRAMATVLRFDHELLMSGRSLPPISFTLARLAWRLILASAP
jgi:hypothetical protein